MRTGMTSAGRLTCLFALLALAPATWTGCKPSPEKQAAREQKLLMELDALLAQTQDLQGQGRLPDAQKQIDKALADKRFAPHRNRLLEQKLSLLLALPDEAAAASLILPLWKQDEAFARILSERLFGHFQSLNNPAAGAAWSARLLDTVTTLGTESREQILGWLLTASVAAADPTVARTAVDRVLSLLPADRAAALLQGAFDRLLDTGQQAVAAPLAAHVASRSTAEPFANLVASVNLRCVLATGNWPTFPEAFATCVARLPDAQLAGHMRPAFLALKKANQPALLEQACHTVLFTAAAKTNAANFAARLWIESGFAVDKRSLPSRLNTLLDQGLSPVPVGGLFDRYFYETINDLELVRTLCAVGERILAHCSDTNTINNLKVKLLDGSFIVEDYDLTIQMLEAKIPGKDDAWHAMALPKVKAHRAMARKEPREAVKHFRAYMDYWIQSDQQEEYDPTSGIAYSREWILGRNANRIADLLETVPDKAAADQARAEAKAYFKVAIEKAAPDAEATKLILEETKGLGL